MLVCVVIMDLRWHLLAWVGSCGDLMGFWWVERGVRNHERVLLGVNGCLWVKARVGGAWWVQNGCWWVETRGWGCKRVLVGPNRGSGELAMGAGAWKRAYKY